MIQKVFKESFLYTFANHAPLLVNIIILPIITPYLSSVDYAIYGLALAYTGALSALGHLGFIPLFQNAYFQNESVYKVLWSKYMGILVVWRLIFGIIVFGVLWLVFRNKLEIETLRYLLFLVVIPIVFFELPKSLGLLLCQYSGRHSRVYTITLITTLISITTTFVGVYYFRLGYMAWLISSFLSAGIQWIYFSWFLRIDNQIKPSYSFSIEFVKENIKKSLPVIPHFYSTYILETSDRLVLDFYKINFSQIGQYNLAYSFCNYFKSFNDAMNTVISPILFKLLAKNEDSVNSSIKNITMLWFYFSLSAAFFISLWMKEVFEFLYRNNSLQESYYLGIFIIMSFAYRPFYVASVDRAIFFGKSETIYKISLSSAIINLILNFSLIPYFGIMAAVISTFICYVYMGFIGFAIADIRSYIKENYPITKIILCIFLTGILAYLIKDISITYKIITTFICLTGLGIFWYKKGYKLYKSLTTFAT